MLERFYLIQNVLITLRFLTLCASVGNKRVFSIVDARCNHEVYKIVCSLIPSLVFPSFSCSGNLCVPTSTSSTKRRDPYCRFTAVASLSLILQLERRSLDVERTLCVYVQGVFNCKYSTDKCGTRTLQVMAQARGLYLQYSYWRHQQTKFIFIVFCF